MSFALITGGGEDGRYTIELDYGEAQRAAILAQVAAAQASLITKIAAQQVHVTAADAQVAASAANLQAIQDQLILSMQTPGYEGLDADMKIYNEFASRHRKLVAGLEPVYSAMRTLKTQQARANSQYSYWSNLTLTETKQAWCCDLTTDASGYVATVDIPGESSLVLIAPGGRGWIAKDGSIAQAKKDAVLALLGGRLIIAEAEKVTLDAKLAAAIANTTTLRTALTNAQAALVAARASGDPLAISEAGKAFDAATKAHNDNIFLVSQLRLEVFRVDARIAKLNLDIAAWTARTASETPVYGDGVFFARELMSPEQAYFNAAILPGWQRYMPTYRWATIDAINDDGTVNLTFGAATSSAQSLDVNDVASLEQVPVTYMTCDSAAFVEGDRCVVQFDASYPNGTDVWTKEKCRVIGFLDNPKKCGQVKFVAHDAFLMYDATTLGSFGYRFWSGRVIDSAVAADIVGNLASYVLQFRKNGGGWETAIISSFVPAWVSQADENTAILSRFFLRVFDTLGAGGYSTANFVMQLSDYQGFTSTGMTVEVLITKAGVMVANFAVEVSETNGGTVIEVDSTLPLTSDKLGGLTARVWAKTAIEQHADSPNTLIRLPDYTLSVDE